MRPLLRLGRERFGEADDLVRREIEAIHDIDVLEELSVRLIKVPTWDDLLA